MGWWHGRYEGVTGVPSVLLQRVAPVLASRAATTLVFVATNKTSRPESAPST
jgi:hypothetical protein